MTDRTMEGDPKASNNYAAAESKIKMYGELIVAHGDPGGKRRQAIRKLQNQLKAAPDDSKSS